MKKSQRIKPLRNLAQDRENHAANALGNSRQLLNEHQLRLKELCDYREEYIQRFREAGQNGMNGMRFQAYQTFINQLDAAIYRQNQLLIEATDDCRLKREDWQQQHMSTQVLDKTVQRFEQHEHQQQEKRSQREADDYVHSRLHKELE